MNLSDRAKVFLDKQEYRSDAVKFANPDIMILLARNEGLYTLGDNFLEINEKAKLTGNAKGQVPIYGSATGTVANYYNAYKKEFDESTTFHETMHQLFFDERYKVIRMQDGFGEDMLTINGVVEYIHDDHFRNIIKYVLPWVQDREGFGEPGFLYEDKMVESFRKGGKFLFGKTNLGEDQPPSPKFGPKNNQKEIKILGNAKPDKKSDDD